MSTIRSGFLALTCLALGFAVGWRLKSPPVSPVILLPNPNASLQAAVVVPSPPIKTPAKNESLSKTFNPARLAAPSITEHLAIIRWLKDSQILRYVGFFDGEHISSEFAKIYALTPTETSQLNEASHQAKQQLEELARQRVQLDPTSSDKKLIVTVPAFPVEGGEIYNVLLTKISSVLGAERYALFDELSTRALDTGFGGFGLSRNRYEVILETVPGGPPVYKMRTAYVYDGNVSGETAGGSTSTVTNAADVMKSFPLLKSFTLPSVPSAPAKQ